MPSDEIVEKVARAIAREAVDDLDMFRGVNGEAAFNALMDLSRKQAKAALSAAEAETQPVARDPSRFSRLSQDERPVIRERPDPTLGFISTAEMLASPSEAAIRADEREKCAKIADDHAEAWGTAMASPAIVIATAIRARGER